MTLNLDPSGPTSTGHPAAEVVGIRDHTDVVAVRQRVRSVAARIGFSIVDQTKLVTAASELARNTLLYGGGGTVRVEVVAEGLQQGVRLTFEDAGPGIPDVAAALRDGFSTGTGMGLGLGGARRLVNEFAIESEVGKGTRVTITRWHAIS